MLVACLREDFLNWWDEARSSLASSSVSSFESQSDITLPLPLSLEVVVLIPENALAVMNFLRISGGIVSAFSLAGGTLSVPAHHAR